MRVVVDAQSIVENRTGIGRYAYNLVKYMQKLAAKDEIIPFYFNFRKKDVGQKTLKNNSQGEIKYLPGCIFNKLWKYTDLFPLDNFLGSSDIYHFPNYTTKPVKSGKKIITVCDMAFRRYQETIEPKNYKTLIRNFEKSLHSADAVITISEFSRQEILHFYPALDIPVYVTYLGVDDFQQHKFTDAQKLYVRKKYSLPDNYLLHVGTIEPRKNLPYLLKVFSSLKVSIPEMKLVLVGARGWLEREFYLEVDRLNLKEDLIIPGYVDDIDLPLLYQLAELFIFPTKYEGFGIPPLEAMASGTPVLASDIPVLREILGSAAEYFSLNSSPEETAELIKYLLNDKENLNANISKGLALSNKFSWNKSAETTLAVYKDIL